MSWVRIDEDAIEHRKQLAAGASACWLWVCGLAYCNRQKAHDGFIPLAKVKLLYPGIGLKEAKRLVDAGLWDELPDGFRIHDYHDYQPTSDEVAARREARAAAGRLGGKRSAEAKAKQLAEATSKQLASDVLKQTSSNGSKQTATPSRPVPSREEEIPPPPSEPSRPRPADPLRDSLTGRRTQDDPGVIAVFEAWKLAHGFTNAKFRQPADHRADVLLEAVVTHGVDTCLRVLEASKTDAMVTGKADEQGQEHRSIEYLFKPTTFDRLLREADKQRAAKPLSAAEATRIARLA